MTTTARTRWQTTLERSAVEDSDLSLFGELRTLYTQAHRAYHNLQHILDCLHQLDALPIPGADQASLELALWFHDAIYQPLKGDNELASAAMAVDRLAAKGLEHVLRQKIYRLIMATTHDSAPADLDEAVMVDVDLSILGRDRAAFKVYETDIRREYRMVPALLYRRKRRAVLRNFLERQHIFNTEAFARKFEQPARKNLEWAISRL